jgi:putative endonuclease
LSAIAGEGPLGPHRQTDGNQMPASPARKPWWRRWFGSRSERAAARFLQRLGYRILVRNYTCREGELDLVALDGRCLVFVEVRSSGTEDPTRPAASVDPAKQRRLTNLAVHFLHQHRLLDRPARFDVLALSWPAHQRQPAIVHYRNAFEAVGRFQMYH